MTITADRTRGRRWAYTGALLGGVVSIAANIAHSYVPPTGVPESWTPPAGAVFGSIVWPVILFFAVEILARVKWPHGGWWALLRFGGFLPIAIVAGFVSYRHLSGLLIFYGEDPLTAVIGPIAVDGLMVMATGALIVTSRPTTDTQAVTPPSTLAAPPSPTVAAAPVAASLPAHLLPSARFAANQHHHATGQPITAEQLASAINLPLPTARQLLGALTEHTPSTHLVPTVNGTPVGTP